MIITWITGNISNFIRVNFNKTPQQHRKVCSPFARKKMATVAWQREACQFLHCWRLRYCQCYMISFEICWYFDDIEAKSLEGRLMQLILSDHNQTNWIHWIWFFWTNWIVKVKQTHTVLSDCHDCHCTLQWALTECGVECVTDWVTSKL